MPRYDIFFLNKTIYLCLYYSKKKSRQKVFLIEVLGYCPEHKKDPTKSGLLFSLRGWDSVTVAKSRSPHFIRLRSLSAPTRPRLCSFHSRMAPAFSSQRKPLKWLAPSPLASKKHPKGCFFLLAPSIGGC